MYNEQSDVYVQPTIATYKLKKGVRYKNIISGEKVTIISDDDDVIEYCKDNPVIIQLENKPFSESREIKEFLKKKSIFLTVFKRIG